MTCRRNRCVDCSELSDRVTMCPPRRWSGRRSNQEDPVVFGARKTEVDEPNVRVAMPESDPLLRNEVDPGRTFGNAYLERVLGS